VLGKFGLALYQGATRETRRPGPAVQTDRHHLVMRLVLQLFLRTRFAIPVSFKTRLTLNHMTVTALEYFRMKGSSVFAALLRAKPLSSCEFIVPTEIKHLTILTTTLFLRNLSKAPPAKQSPTSRNGWKFRLAVVQFTDRPDNKSAVKGLILNFDRGMMNCGTNL
jgi:hypothetical protein